MHIPKHYFQDRIVLLLLGSSVALTLIGSILILLRLGGGQSDGYIVQYRANLGISAFETGSILNVISFIVFLFAVLGFHTVLSMRIYHVRRHAAIAILGLGVLLLVLSVVVSNALLILR